MSVCWVLDVPATVQMKDGRPLLPDSPNPWLCHVLRNQLHLPCPPGSAMHCTWSHAPLPCCPLGSSLGAVCILGLACSPTDCCTHCVSRQLLSHTHLGVAVVVSETCILLTPGLNTVGSGGLKNTPGNAHAAHPVPRFVMQLGLGVVGCG